MSDRETEQKFTELLNVMAHLRSDAGCPWDRSQTHLSLKPCLLEEIRPGLWVASGGAKNGMLAAGWAAHEICRRTS